MPTTAKPAPSWRDVLKIHPAAELFPLMASDELQALGEDIKKNRLREPVTVLLPDRSQPPWQGAALLDGRNRLDAMEVVGIQLIGEDGHLSSCLHVHFRFSDDTDPIAYVISANIHRRHLTGEQRRDLIGKLLKATPEKSDRQIGEMIKADHKTVGAVRAQKEATGEISPVEKRVGKDRKTRKQPARKPATAFAAKPRPAATVLSRNHANASEIKRLRARVEELQAENRRLEIENVGLRSEIEDAKAARGPKSLSELRPQFYSAASVLAKEDRISEVQHLVEVLGLSIRDLDAAIVADLVPPADDGLGIPGFLDRTHRAAPKCNPEQNITTASPGSK